MLSFLNKRYILIVDDNKINRILLSKILKDNYEILEAENGKQALDILIKNKYIISAVLLDIIMPVMNGYEFLKEIKNHKFLSTTPVIVLTEEDMVESQIKALSLGASDFLSKPYTPPIILHKLANIIKIKETSILINNCEKDTLTKLYTKEAFYSKTEDIIKQNANIDYNIVTIDIDNFKLINDTYGDIEGDRLLCHAADFLQEFVVPYGGICTRLTGDVFACIVPQNKYSVNDIIKNIDLFNQNYHINIDISIKVGIYQVKDRNISIRKMCDMANLAMNTIKGKYDKYYAFYNEKIGENLRRENQIVFDMQEALKQKQFKVYFQPKFDINTNKIIGAEALVRWQHPKMGFIMPNDFIPVFEKNGFITDLDRYVWDYACYKLSQWIKAGNAPFPISVNVSRIDFYNPNLCEILTDIVQKYDVPFDLLHLEITETAYSKNQKQLISVVAKLKNRGFIIEMDDFGSGYSSLNVINEMPVDILKLDVKFLKHSSSNYHNNSILKFVINLANDLNFDVIAEGIETVHDIKTLEDNGCRYGQGYYFSKPIPEEDFEKLLSQTKVDNISSVSKVDIIKNKSYNDYIKILNTVPFGIAHFTDDFTTMICANNTLANMLGYNTSKELLSKNLSLKDIVPPKFIWIFEQKLCEVKSLSNKKILTFNIDLICANKIENNLNCSLQLVDGYENIVQVTFSDITPSPVNSVIYRQMKTIVDCLPGGFFKYRADGDGVITFATDTFYEMTGYTKEEFAEEFDNRFEKLIYPIDRERVLKQIQQQLLNDYIDRCEYRVLTKNGTLKWFYNVGHIYIDDNGIRWIYVIVIDNTELKRLQVQSEINKERYECILPYTQDVIFEWDTITNKIYTTDTFKQKFGYCIEEKNIITQIRANEYILDEDWQDFYNVIYEISCGKTFGQCEVRVKKVDNSYIWCKITATTIKDSDNKIVKVVGVLSDISEHKQKLESVQKIADTDYLTQTYNRTGFIKYINEYLKFSNNMSALLIIDIDYFKNINDSYGHKVGDKILKDIANILKHQARNDDIVGRLGGDEFVVFLKNIYDVSEAVMLSKTICKKVENNTITTCSIGVTVSPKNCRCFDELYVSADSALYESKAKGRNTYTLSN